MDYEDLHGCKLCFSTCDDVSDGFDERSKGGDVRLAVLPHWLPYYQATGQSEGQVRLLKRQRRKQFYPSFSTVQSSSKLV